MRNRRRYYNKYCVLLTPSHPQDNFKHEQEKALYSLKTSDDEFSALEKIKYMENRELRLEMRDAERKKP